MNCNDCYRILVEQEQLDNFPIQVTLCNECDIKDSIINLAEHIREERFTIEEVIRKLIIEVDK